MCSTDCPSRHNCKMQIHLSAVLDLINFCWESKVGGLGDESRPVGSRVVILMKSMVHGFFTEFCVVDV